MVKQRRQRDRALCSATAGITAIRAMRGTSITRYGATRRDLLFQMRVEYADGSSELVVSDGSWKTALGPIVFDGIRNGESYDARLEKRGWDTIEYSDTDWNAAEIVDGPGGKLVAQGTPAGQGSWRRSGPVKIIEPRPGVFVFDMGCNIAGWCELKVAGPAGTRVTLKYDERVHPRRISGSAERGSPSTRGSSRPTSIRSRVWWHGDLGAEVRLSRIPVRSGGRVSGQADSGHAALQSRAHELRKDRRFRVLQRPAQQDSAQYRAILREQFRRLP